MKGESSVILEMNFSCMRVIKWSKNSMFMGVVAFCNGVDNGVPQLPQTNQMTPMNYRLPGTETRQIFSLMFVMANQIKSCLSLL